MKRLVVIGAGYAGSCVARMFRDQFDVLVLEGDSMPGGLCKSYYRDGLVYEYGPHILANHNCSEEAIAFLRSHVDTVDTKVTSASFVRDRTTWYPVHRRNAALLGLETEVEAELRGLPAAPRMDNFETYLVDRVGRTLYEIYFADFTRKFWGVDPASLSADWARTRHLGESLDAEEMFFNRSWCAYPRGDWNDLFRNLLKETRVIYDAAVARVLPEERCVVLRSGPRIEYDLLLSTASIDFLFDHRLGKLTYRGYEIEPRVVDRPAWATFNGKPVSMTYYPEANVPYTRITDYGSFQRKEECPTYRGRTIVTVETPSASSELYPSTDRESLQLFDRYVRLASGYPEIVTFGRKGLYKYLTTDTATEMALRLRDHLFSWEALSNEARYAAYQEIRGSWNN